MKKIEDYTKEELIALYKRMDIYMATKYISLGKYYDDDDKKIFKVDMLWNGDRSSIPVNVNFWYKEIHIDRAKRLLESSTSETKSYYYKAQIAYYTLIWKSLWYFASGWMKVTPEEKELDDTKPMDPKTAFNHLVKLLPDELDKLTINDEINIENGRATDFKTLQFVYETLIHCSKEEVQSLLKLADKGLKTNWESIDTGKNSGKKKIVRINSTMPAKQMKKYNLESGSRFESQKELAEYCNVSTRMIIKWKKANYIEEIENEALTNDELLKIKESLNL